MTEGRYFGWNMLDENLNHILEFGVASGDTLNSNTREINRAFPNKRFTVRGFDTFTGLPEDWTSFDNNIIAFKGVFSTNGVVPELFNDVKENNDIDFYVGLFEDTIPKYIEKEAQSIAFLHVDSDLYSSAKTVLYSLKDYIVPGTVIRFDEWVYWNDLKYNDHEQRLFYEWVSDFNVKYEFFKDDPHIVDSIGEKAIEYKFVLITG
jgi:hypothetical protein